MNFFRHLIPAVTAAAALAALAAPAGAATDTRLQAFALDPVGNLGAGLHGIDYGIGYSVAKVGPVHFSPLVDVSSFAGDATFHLGAAATVDVTKHVDVGVAEVQRPGFAGFRKLQTDAVVGLHL